MPCVTIARLDGVIGVGGDPMTLGSSVFAIGALTLGILFVGVFPASALGMVVPIITFAAGFVLLLTTVRALIQGKAFLAGVFCTVARLFLSFAAIVVGLAHNWYAIPKVDIAPAEAVYLIVLACYFMFLIVPFLRLPLLYPIIVFLVFVGLSIDAASQLVSTVDLGKLAGVDFLAIRFALLWARLNTNTTVMGRKRFPPIGTPLVYMVTLRAFRRWQSMLGTASNSSGGVCDETGISAEVQRQSSVVDNCPASLTGRQNERPRTGRLSWL